MNKKLIIVLLSLFIISFVSIVILTPKELPYDKNGNPSLGVFKEITEYDINGVTKITLNTENISAYCYKYNENTIKIGYISCFEERYNQYKDTLKISFNENRLSISTDKNTPLIIHCFQAWLPLLQFKEYAKSFSSPVASDIIIYMPENLEIVE